MISVRKGFNYNVLFLSKRKKETRPLPAVSSLTIFNWNLTMDISKYICKYTKLYRYINRTIESKVWDFNACASSYVG